MSDRLRYPEEHWGRLEDPAAALDQYQGMYSDAYNETKATLYIRLLGDVTGLRVLDYGGGAGFMSVSLAKRGAGVVLVDAEEGGPRTAKYYAQREGDAESERSAGARNAASFARANTRARQLELVQEALSKVMAELPRSTSGHHEGDPVAGRLEV
jgi:hypothetical protein